MSQQSIVHCTPTTEPAALSAESLGAWLARTRVSHDVDLRVAARRLGLNPILIQALEADDFTQLGPPVFVRGYLSRYARFLDLPEQAVLERYRQQAAASQEPPPLKVVLPQRRQTQVRDLTGFFYLLVVIGVGWTTVQHLGELDASHLSAWLTTGAQQNQGAQTVSKPMAVTTQTHYPFQSKPPETVSEPAPAAPVTPAAKEPAPAPGPEPDSNSAIALSTLSASRAGAAPTVAMPVVATTTVSATVAATSSHSTPDSRSDARLMLQFSDDCWIEVKDAQGKVLANGLMKANTTHAISGSAPFVVTLGNAPAARIALDDRLVDSSIYLPRRGTVSRFTLTPAP